MYKLWLVILLCLANGYSARAYHISGGEIYYTYLGKSAINSNQLSYRITLVLYKDTTAQGRVANLESQYNISIYRADNNNLVSNVTLPRVLYEIMNLQKYSPCLTNKPRVEYNVATYSRIIDLDSLAAGYFISHSQCCRVTTLVNVNSSSPLVGATYWVKIPGTTATSVTPLNSSAYFNKKDTILVCKNSPMVLDFSATDPDKDSLVYRLSNAYLGADEGNPRPLQSEVPPYTIITYEPGYSALQPFGTNISIDSKTGLVTGQSPDNTGIYLIAVVVEEYRNGLKVGEHRKDFQINIQNCSIKAASLSPVVTNCSNFTVIFENNSTNSNITNYLWSFGDGTQSTDPRPTHNYADTGIYIAKLKVTSDSANAGGCQDSATTQVKVFPGFTVQFKVTGSCVLNPYQFTDSTINKYGFIIGWRWNFGETTTTNDTSNLQNPIYKYPTVGTKQVTLHAISSKGCDGSATVPLQISDKPIIKLPFKDTLICNIDSLLLNSNAQGDVVWTPAKNITNAAISNPIVFPKDTTIYHITVSDNGCSNEDSIQVNVLPFITVDAGADTNICKTDTFRLHPVSQALSYKWVASTNEVVSAEKYPLVQPLVNTIYYVNANLGKCQSKDTIRVFAFNYPKVSLTTDSATICYNASVQLNGSINVPNFSWQPTTGLLNSLSLQPIAKPIVTTMYVLTATDTVGCKKPAHDTITVVVIDSVVVFAGNDTSVVLNQPLQFNAVSSVDAANPLYNWVSSLPNNKLYFTGAANTQNPTALFTDAIDSVLYKVRVTEKHGCYGQDSIKVLVYRILPDILVPSGFTPNGDGVNDIEIPIPIGIKKLNYFNVYNRWGQLIFTTSEIGKGWNGNFNGIQQSSGAYVFTVQGIDYLGKTIYRTGTIVLIR